MESRGGQGKVKKAQGGLKELGGGLGLLGPLGLLALPLAFPWTP